MDKLKFPIEGQDVCPDCGCEECIGAQTIGELEADQKIPEGAFPDGLALSFPLYNQQTLQKLVTNILVGNPKVAVLAVYVRICAECHRIYVRKIDLVWQEMQVQAMPAAMGQRMQSPPGKGLGGFQSPFMGKG